MLIIHFSTQKDANNMVLLIGHCYRLDSLADLSITNLCVGDVADFDEDIYKITVISLYIYIYIYISSL